MSKLFKNNKYYIITLIIIIILSIIHPLLKQYYSKTKTLVAVFGSVSRNIDNDTILKQDLSFLASHLNNKYDYVIPNTNTGVIGYLLHNLQSNNVAKNIQTTYVTSFSPENINNNYKINYFDTIMDFEDDMLKRSDVFVFLPGGIGTLYELSYTLFVLLERIRDIHIILFNQQGEYDFIIDKIETLHNDGYLRPQVYELYKQNCIIVTTTKQIITFLNTTYATL